MAVDPVTGQIYNELEGSLMHEDTGNVSFLYAPISQAVTASTVVIAGTAGKKIRVLKLTITAVTAGQTVTFQSQTGPTALTGPLQFPANGQLNDSYVGGLFETAVGDGLYLALGGATQVSGYIVYVLH